jgi:hypothetical protein
VKVGHRRQIAHARHDGRKARQQHARVLPSAMSAMRQRAGDVRQAAGLEEGKEFGADLEDSHRAAVLGGQPLEHFARDQHHAGFGALEARGVGPGPRRSPCPRE